MPLPAATAVKRIRFAAYDLALHDAGLLGRRAGEKAVARLSPRRPKTARLPVVYDPRVASSLLGHLVGAVNGAAVARGTSFLKDRPDDARKYIAAYARAVEFVRKNPAEVRKHLDGFTSIDPSLVNEVPLSGFTLYNEFSASDIGYFQKFFDVFTERKIFSRAVPVKPLIYVG